MIVLITGTTSGIGKSLANDFLKKNDFVIHVNRGKSFKTVSYSNNEIFFESNIVSLDDIELLFKELVRINKVPNKFFLNAGVNIPDINMEIDILNFHENFNINFYGSLNFISTCNKFKLENRTFILFSSTSNIVPNPRHFGYYLSKFALFKATSFLSSSDKKNIYKCIILGPVNTNISRYFQPPKGFQKYLLMLLIVKPEDCAKKIIKFSSSNKKYLYFPFKAVLIYFLARFFLYFFPKAYKS